MKKIAMFLLLSLILTPSVWAQRAVDDVWSAANSEVYGTKFGGMLGRGLLNATTCFVDVIVHTVEGSKQGPPIVGSLTGLGSGIACTALRATSGVLDIATFWVPGFNGFPVSRSYSNCLDFEQEKELEVKSKGMPLVAAPAPGPEQYAKPAAPAVVPTPGPEQYAKPAAAAEHHDALDYVKK